MEHLKSLNEEQLAVVLNHTGNNAVLASAGSGKTKTIIARVTHLIKELNVPPSTIWVGTFTKKAKEELLDRLSIAVGSTVAKKVKMGTLHSLAFSIYRNGLILVDKKNNYSLPKLIKNENIPLFQIFNFIRANEKLVHNKDGKDFLNEINMRKMKGITLDNCRKFYPFEPDSNKWSYNQTIYNIWNFYDDWKIRTNQIDFSDMLVRCVEMLNNDKYGEYVKSLQRSCNYIITDESQDNNKLNYIIAEKLSEISNNFTVVGDLRQCQPRGTKVLTTGGLEVDISKIKVGTEVVSFRRDKTYFGGISRQGMKVTEKNKRLFKGNMFTLSCDGKKTRATPNHKFLAKYNIDKKNCDLHVVYMMNQPNTDKFRIGWCKLFTTGGLNHFFFRCRMENANGWILRVCKDKSEASFYESLYSTNYGLPLVMFNEAKVNTLNGKKPNLYTQDFLDKMFTEFKYIRKKALRCLSDFGKEIEYPYYNLGEQKNIGRNTVFEIQVCNILPDIMSVPSFRGNKKANYSSVKLSYKYEECFVYSLNVDVNHTYVSDGISTCNSIFSFQGSSPDNLHDFIKRKKPTLFNLKTNYRSTKTIVDNSNVFIAGASGIIGEASVAFKGDGSDIKFCTSEDVSSEAYNVMYLIEDLINKGYNYNDIAVLYRVHSQSVMVESAFLNNNIPYVTFTKDTFFDRKEVKDIIGYLTAFAEPYYMTFETFKRIISRPNRYISTVALNEVKKYCEYEGVSIWEAITDDINNIKIDYRNRKCIVDFVSEIVKGGIKYKSNADVKTLIKYVLEDIGYEKFANGDKPKESDGDVTMDFDAIIDLVDSFHTLEAFFNYVEKIKEQESIRKGNEEGNHIKMMTFHASKGREFPVVITLGNCTRIMPFHRNADIEEEKRLMYVAITRPEKELYVSVINGNLGRYKVTPSPFLYKFKKEYEINNYDSGFN